MCNEAQGTGIPPQFSGLRVKANVHNLQAAYYALFKMGRFGFYLLVPGHTNAYSLLTNALLMCRFAPPLAFNFMAALAMPASKHDERHDVTETVRLWLSSPFHLQQNICKPT